MSCNYTIDENGQYNFDQSTQIATEIFESSLINNRVGCVMEFVDSYEGIVCSAVQCTGANHDPGEDCECDTSLSCEEAFISCATGTIYIYEENCSGGSGSTGSNGNTEPDTGGPGGSGTGSTGSGFIWKPIVTPINQQLKSMLNMQDLTLERATWIDDPANAFDKVWPLVNLANSNRNDEGLVDEEISNLILELMDLMIVNPEYDFEETKRAYLNLRFLNKPSEFAPTYEIAPNDIIDIQEYLDCFQNATPNDDFEMTIFVEQPKPGSRDPYKIISLLDQEVDVGHTFISLKMTDISGNTINQTIGYYPDPNNIPTLDNPSATGFFVDNGQHNYNISATSSLSYNDFTNVINYLGGLSSFTYDLNNFNCTDLGIQAANQGGVSLPDTLGTWEMVFVGSGAGSNLGDLGEDLRNLNNPNITVNTPTSTSLGSIAPGASTSNGPCN